jgi:hypothetical protein
MPYSDCGVALARTRMVPANSSVLDSNEEKLAERGGFEPPIEVLAPITV